MRRWKIPAVLRCLAVVWCLAAASACGVEPEVVLATGSPSIIDPDADTGVCPHTPPPIAEAGDHGPHPDRAARSGAGSVDFTATYLVHPDGSGDAASLAAALDIAPPGSMIMLTPGTHLVDHVVIDHELIDIYGWEDTVVAPMPGRCGPALTVAGGSVQITGFVISAHPDGDPADSGPLLEVRGGDVRLLELTTRNSGGTGAAVLGGSGSIEYSFFDDNAGAGLEVGARVGEAFTISSSQFYDNHVGLVVLGAPEVVLNDARGNDTAGMRWQGNAGGIVDRNFSTENGGLGYEILDAANPVMSRNGPPPPTPTPLPPGG